MNKNYDGGNCIYNQESKYTPITAKDSSQDYENCNPGYAKEDLDNVIEIIDCKDVDDLKKANIITQFLAQEKLTNVKSYDAKSDEKPSIITLMNKYLTKLQSIEDSKLVGNKNLNNINAIAKISGCKNKSTDDEYYKCLTTYDKTTRNKPLSYPIEYYNLLGIKDLVPIKGGKKHSKKRKNKSNKKHKKSKKNSSIKKRGNKEKRTKSRKN